MKKIAKVSAISIAAAFIFAFSILVSAAQEPTGKVKVRPKPTQRPAQLGIVTRVVETVVPGGSPNYQKAAQDPNLRPNYEKPSTYQNPLVRRIELPEIATLQEAREWLSNPTTAPDRRARQPQNVPAVRSTPFFTGSAYMPTTPAEARTIVSTYGSVPTGMVLEGTAVGLGRINELQYDAVLNAFVLDDRAVYFSSIAPQSLAVLCRAIAQDDKARVGVALGQVQIVYGKLPHESQVAIDLKLADNFLGNIAFAQTNWLPEGYPLAKGYVPQPDPEATDTAVTFNLKGFQFEIAQEIIRITKTGLEVRLIPVSKERAEDGGELPDYEALARGAVSQQYEANARHVADEIEYYRREKFVDSAFRYGEVAAFIRALKAERVDLEELAEIIEQSTGVGQLVIGPPSRRCKNR